MIIETTLFILIAIGLCFLMLLFQELGIRIALKRVERDPQKGLQGTGVIEGGIFAVWGLLLAFTFSGAASRFDLRRTLVGQEANAIGTAFLRLDLLPSKEREILRKKFQIYLETRLETYRKADRGDNWKEPFKKSLDLQNEIWVQAVTTIETLKQPMAAILVLPALNAMIDIVTTRLVATMMHPPWIVYLLLLGMSLFCVTLIGFNQAQGKYKHSLHLFGFIVVTTLIIYVIIDMEYPRRGLIRVDSVDAVLGDLLQSIKNQTLQ